MTLGWGQPVGGVKVKTQTSETLLPSISMSGRWSALRQLLPFGAVWRLLESGHLYVGGLVAPQVHRDAGIGITRPKFHFALRIGKLLGLSGDVIFKAVIMTDASPNPLVNLSDTALDFFRINAAFFQHLGCDGQVFVFRIVP